MIPLRSRAQVLPYFWLFTFSTCLYSATVRGLVTDANGNPVPHALVEVADPYRPQTTLSDYVQSDANGHFEKDGITPGIYMVFASEPKSGYGDTRIAMFAAGLRIPEITIHKPEETIDVEVNIGFPGAYLAASVIGKTVSTAVSGAHVRIVLEAEPAKYMSFSADQQGDFETLVPARPIAVMVSAPGYKDQNVVLSLSQAEHRTITFALEEAR